MGHTMATGDIGSGGSSRVRARERELLVAAFTNGETDRLSRELGFGIAVITVTLDVADHAAFLTNTFHGCWRPRRGWILPFDFWHTDHLSVGYGQLAFDPRWLGRFDLPPGMSVGEGCLRIRVPAGTSRLDLAQAFGLAMHERRFELIARRPREVRRRHRSSRELEVASRYSLDPSLTGTLPSVAEDIYAFRPRDLPGVVRAAERARALLELKVTLKPAASETRRRARHA